MEYELLDTGVFDEDRYFDVFVEYAKKAPKDILIRSRCESWARAGDGSRPAHAVVSQHLVVVAGLAEAFLAATAASGVAASPRPMPSSATLAVLRRDRRCCSPRTRRTGSGSSGPPTRRPTSRTASTTSSSRGRHGGGEPRPGGTKAAAHYRMEVGAGRDVVRLRLTSRTER